MTEPQLKQYKIELVPETNTPTDHELLLEVLKEIKEIKSDVAVLKSDVAILKSDVKTLKSDVTLLKSDVKSINNRIDNLVLKNNLKE